jgi:hypothetical protein
MDGSPADLQRRTAFFIDVKIPGIPACRYRRPTREARRDGRLETP